MTNHHGAIAAVLLAFAGVGTVSSGTIDLLRASAAAPIAGERPSSSRAALVLPAGISDVAIETSMPDEPAPALEYRLVGFEGNSGSEAPTLRRSFASVAPGTYRLQVLAGGDQARLAAPAAEMLLVVPPPFYRSPRFVIATTITMVGLLTVAWRQRVVRSRRQYAFLVEERLRLSREIHDTILQSLVGVALQCDALANELEGAEPARERFQRLRREVEADIREARQAIWNLRAPSGDQDDLVSALQRMGDEAVAGTRIAFSLHATGRPFSDATGQDQLLRIGHEALLNAVRHAQASHITMRIDCSGDAITLSVSDDGRGFAYDSAVIGKGRHFGLLSMRERAEAAGGRFSLVSRAGQGTTVQASVAIHRVPAGT